jgi:hypothetical protein
MLDGAKNPNPMLITAKKIVQTSRQITDYLLCSGCEQRFSKNGENYAMSLVAHRGKFPLLAMLQRVPPTKTTPVFTWYDHAAVPNVDREKLGYYALSIFWRASVHVWEKHEQKSPMIALGPYDEDLRKYLLGQAGFPKDAALMFIVCTDNLSQNTFYVPNKGHADQETYTFQTRGLNVFLMLGQQLSDPMRTLCSVTGADRWILTRSCHDKVWEGITRLTAGRKLPL